MSAPCEEREGGKDWEVNEPTEADSYSSETNKEKEHAWEPDALVKWANPFPKQNSCLLK